MFTCTKKFTGFPFAHRSPRHPGHCQFIHGHDWSFEFEFACTHRDPCGFVVDFGDLGWLKDWLSEQFDHTLVLSDSDPLLPVIRAQLTDVTHEGRGPVDLARIVVVPDCGSEGLAEYLFAFATGALKIRYDGRVFLRRVTVYEGAVNSASLTNININVKVEPTPTPHE